MSSGHSSSAGSECRWHSFRTDRNGVKTRNGVEVRTNLKRKMPLERHKFGAGNEQNENRFVVPHKKVKIE